MILMRTFYLGLGANSGDRSSTIAQAIQGLRRLGRIDACASLYETDPVGVEGPAFYNTVVRIETGLEPDVLQDRLRALEERLGRAQNCGNSARPIDLDLLPGDLSAIPPYYAAALAELEPQRFHPNTPGVRRRERALRFRADRQSGNPEVALAIDRVGVQRIVRPLRLMIDDAEQTVLATFSLSADLAFNRAGVHMSRFSEHLETAVLEAFAAREQHGGLETFLETLARDIQAAQHASSAEIRLEAPFTLTRWSPLSGRRGDETYRLLARTRAAGAGARTMIGVEVEGMTACPCAQEMMREHSFKELVDAGFSDTDAGRALDIIPAATHNQRSRGRLWLGLTPGEPASIRLEDLVELVEQSMSSETYEMLKRPDEFFVVNKAHRNPKFVEDVVRGMVSRTLDFYEDFSGQTFVQAEQTNDESIHKHDAVAVASGSFEELRAELQGRTPGNKRFDAARWFAAQLG